jgi:FkbM family methyltransferase
MNIAPYRNIIAINKALSDTNGTVSLIDRRTGAWGFSIVEKPADTATSTFIHEVQTTTVPEIITDFGSTGIDLLKLDIEGAERDLFISSPLWVKSVRVLFVELHDRIAPGCVAAFARATIGRKNTFGTGEKVLSSLGD